jgi:DNA-binding transcriptional LysR family regulator
MFLEELAVLAAPTISCLEEALAGGTVRIIVLRARCSYRQMLETVLARRGIAVQRHLEFGTLEAIFGCVAAGLGITMMPRALIGGIRAASRVSAHALPPSEAMVGTVFIRRRDGFTSSVLKVRDQPKWRAPRIDPVRRVRKRGHVPKPLLPLGRAAGFDSMSRHSSGCTRDLEGADSVRRFPGRWG